MDTVFINNTSLYDNKFFVSILDDYTRFGWVLFIKSKDQVFDAFLSWYKNIKNIFNKSIKYLRTDNGTEFTNRRIINFCIENGISHDFSVPYEPQQNGRIERLHVSLIPNSRATIEDAHLSHIFWEDAINTANYIHSRIPHRGIENKVPFELLYNKKVDYNRFKVFGCQVFFLVPKQFRKKLHNTSLPGIFIGYDSNPTTYRIYDITNNKVVISHSVVFFEDTPGNCSAPSSIPDTINLTPYYEIGGSSNEVSVEFNDNNMNNNMNNNESTINKDNLNNNSINTSNMDENNNKEVLSNYNNILNHLNYYPSNNFIQNYPYQYQYNLNYPNNFNYAFLPTHNNNLKHYNYQNNHDLQNGQLNNSNNFYNYKYKLNSDFNQNDSDNLNPNNINNKSNQTNNNNIDLNYFNNSNLNNPITNNKIGQLNFKNSNHENGKMDPNQYNSNKQNNNTNQQKDSNLNVKKETKKPFDLVNLIDEKNNQDPILINNAVKNVSKQVSNTNSSTQNSLNNKNRKEINSTSKKKYDDELNEDIVENSKKRKAFNYFNMVALSNVILDAPVTYEEILNREDKQKWLEDIADELKNMKDKHVYIFVKKVPKEKHIISAICIFSLKRNDVGIITRYKARLVARGFSQIYGII